MEWCLFFVLYVWLIFIEGGKKKERKQKFIDLCYILQILLKVEEFNFIIKFFFKKGTGDDKELNKVVESLYVKYIKINV